MCQKYSCYNQSNTPEEILDEGFCLLLSLELYEALLPYATDGVTALVEALCREYVSCRILARRIMREHKDELDYLAEH